MMEMKMKIRKIDDDGVDIDDLVIMIINSILMNSSRCR